MAGNDMLSFVDLGKDTVKRHLTHPDWTCSWIEWDGLKHLIPEGLYKEGNRITDDHVGAFQQELLLII